MTKTQLIQAVMAKHPDLTKADIGKVIDALPAIAIEELKKDGGTVVIPGLVKLRAVTKGAQPERQGLDPFTKQPRTFPAKPETTKVKALPLNPVKTAFAEA